MIRLSNIKLLALTIAASFCVVAAAGSQTGAPQASSPQEPTTLRVNTTLINTVLTVADKNGKGKFITNLKQTDFKIYEDGKPQTITNFSTEADLPLSIALLVDTSGSIRDKLGLEQDAAIEFFKAVLHRGKDKGMVVSFDSHADLVQDFTDDGELLAKSIRKIQAGGGTSLFDAVYLVINERLAKEPDNRRKVIVLVSDGDDNSSRIAQTEVLTLAQRHGVIVYCISTNQSGFFGGKEQDRGDKVLKALSNETGGRSLFPLKAPDIAKDFRDISLELRSQYSIGYITSRPDDNTFRRLKIDVVSNKSYKARARSGYYSSKPTVTP
jgi:VWFA-related protein